MNEEIRLFFSLFSLVSSTRRIKIKKALKAKIKQKLPKIGQVCID
jgi:hypothetical protein